MTKKAGKRPGRGGGKTPRLDKERLKDLDADAKPGEKQPRGGGQGRQTREPGCVANSDTCWCSI